MKQSESEANISRPRKPERANGKERYALLCETAAAIVMEEGAASLTIQKIAKQAAVPMASVYHFFPSPTAALVAVAQTYLDEFTAAVERSTAFAADRPWQDTVADLMSQVVSYYNQQPSAARLLLGSDTNWQIRQADFSNAEILVKLLCESLSLHFAPASQVDLADTFRIAMAIADGIWALSVALEGGISDHYAREALKATTAYIDARLGSPQSPSTRACRPGH